MITSSMSDSQTLLEIESAKGDKAQDLYDSFFREYFDSSKKELDQMFLDTDDKDQLLKIHFASCILDNMKSHLVNYISTGDLAKFELNRNKD